MNKMKRRDLVVYMITGVLLAIAFTLIMSVRVQSRTQEAILFDNRNYETAEEDYKERVQMLLEKYGCYNSGLTMTRMVSLEGEREYNIQIYNKKLSQLSEKEFASLQRELSEYKVVLADRCLYEVEVIFLK